MSPAEGLYFSALVIYIVIGDSTNFDHFLAAITKIVTYTIITYTHNYNLYATPPHTHAHV